MRVMENVEPKVLEPSKRNMNNRDYNGALKRYFNTALKLNKLDRFLNL